MPAGSMRTRIDPVTADLVGYAVRDDLEGGRAAALELLRQTGPGALPAATRRLLPLFAGGLEPSSARSSGAERVLSQLHQTTGFTNQQLWRAACDVAAAFRDAGIEVMFLKGIALLPAYRSDWGARPMMDIDVAVPARSLVPAVSALDELGWRSDRDVGPRTIVERLRLRRHSEGFHLDSRARLDLHWHVLRTSLGARSDDGFWARRTVVPIGGQPTPVLAPEDLLVNVLVHGTTGLVAPSAQWLVDAARLLDVTDVDAIAPRVDEVAREHAVVALCCDALDVLTSFGAERAAVVRAALGRRRPTIVELARRHGPGALAAELTAHAAGGNGLVRAVPEVVRDRTDTALARRPAVMAGLAAIGHHAALERWAARAVGQLSRTTEPAPAVAPGVVLDFDEPATFEQHATAGWSYDPSEGTRTRGAAARVLLDAPDVDRLTLVLASEGAVVDVLVDGERVTTVTLGDGQPTAVIVRAGGTPVTEVTLVRRGRRPREKVRLMSISATI